MVAECSELMAAAKFTTYNFKCVGCFTLVMSGISVLLLLSAFSVCGLCVFSLRLSRVNAESRVTAAAAGAADKPSAEPQVYKSKSPNIAMHWLSGFSSSSRSSAAGAAAVASAAGAAAVASAAGAAAAVAPARATIYS